MNNLENILDITAAISAQKGYKKETVPKFINPFKKEKNSLDLDAKVRNKEENVENFLPKLDEKLSGKKETVYGFFESFSEYVSKLKDKLYSYYSNIKGAFKEVLDNNAYKDKLLNEIEDWGVIYYKSTFRKLTRLTLIGYMARYLQKLWICVSKHTK